MIVWMVRVSHRCLYPSAKISNQWQTMRQILIRKKFNSYKCFAYICLPKRAKSVMMRFFEYNYWYGIKVGNLFYDQGMKKKMLSFNFVYVCQSNWSRYQKTLSGITNWKHKARCGFKIKLTISDTRNAQSIFMGTAARCRSASHLLCGAPYNFRQNQS